MNRISQNELIGTVALQIALENSPDHSLALSKAMLILPLIFDRTIRSVLKRKNSIVLSSKDLIVSNPGAFTVVRAKYEDLTITSLNTILLAKELGMITLEDHSLSLRSKIFFRDATDIGKIATEIFDSGPKLGLILRESTLDLYQTFRIEL
ncbi:hypothetical protein N5J01_02330 [Stenotrophomonas sp. GD03701]|jgi:hypothetical protein|uniref:Uncharacterized protein n=2 Tax=Stenotrophomonas maltophilia group TaxID=995085 RepID=A0A2J0T0L1_STEMA|nr:MULTISPECIES: hypothetical protein [Stenotrophomonas]MBA0312181.1 hypothetical protein [Stenotrophomonas maltophilia]MDH1387243.1 hypothetical protein [Stenotrophomonas sp. GD03701]MDH1391335.1 hypothetical protein [Stenotrophomonas sp. GD03702]MDQ7302514.1 hypothetical protein [Stenotrophomonas sp. Sm0581]PJL03921.1 hypothetical protein B9Y57_08445 [Stenotrophomonas maltophilia]